MINNIEEESLFRKYDYEIVHYKEYNSYCLYYVAKYHNDFIGSFDSKEKCFYALLDILKDKIKNLNALKEEIYKELKNV